MLNAEEIQRVRDGVSITKLLAETCGPGEVKGRTRVFVCPSCLARKLHANELRGFYHCFGCKESGSAIDWVMQTMGKSFPDAVRWLEFQMGSAK